MKNGVTAYILVNCTLGKEQEVLDHLCKIDDIVEARATYGMHDIFLRVRTLNNDTLAAVMEMIRKTPNMLSTSTLNAIAEYGGKSDGKEYCANCGKQIVTEPE